MFIVLWEYQVKPQLEHEFETFHAEEGIWVELFRRAKGYRGTHSCAT
jgi:hypothetical protein